MCGIFGWLVFNSRCSPIDEEKAKYLTNLQYHRGPDSCGFFSRPQIFLGHRRLKIIDLSTQANQPMSDESGRYTLVFNGEIYNYIELKQELIESGQLFKTESDTEVLLKLYLSYGRRCLDKIQGMFAFAVYDSQEHSLFLARDHLGQKPLYYTATPDGFLFASELRSLLFQERSAPPLDLLNTLKYHLTDSFLFETTPFANIKKLMPAHFLVATEKRIEIQRYWDSLPIDNSQSQNIETMIGELDMLMQASVKRHLRADVPCGVFLSGGVDSSLIAHYARLQLGAGHPLKSFTVAVDCPHLNEQNVAQAMAKFARCDSHLYHLNETILHEQLTTLFQTTDEPLADPGLCPSYFIAQQAANHVRVALAGDGGDELFGGYLSFKAVAWDRLASYLPADLFASMILVVRKLLGPKNRYMSLDFKLQQFMQGQGQPALLKLPSWLSPITLPSLCNLYRPEYLHDSGFTSPASLNMAIFHDFQNHFKNVQHIPLPDLMLYQYQKYFLPEFVLAHTDRASMQSSLEVRSPFVDKDLTTFANKIPATIKIKNGRLKSLLHDLMKNGHLPAEVRAHKKRGFTFPVASWLQHGLRPQVLAMLDFMQTREPEIWNLPFLQQVVQEHMSGKKNHYRLLWNLLILVNWKKNFLYRN